MGDFCDADTTQLGRFGVAPNRVNMPSQDCPFGNKFINDGYNQDHNGRPRQPLIARQKPGPAANDGRYKHQLQNKKRHRQVVNHAISPLSAGPDRVSDVQNDTNQPQQDGYFVFIRPESQGGNIRNKPVAQSIKRIIGNNNRAGCSCRKLQCPPVA